MLPEAHPSTGREGKSKEKASPVGFTTHSHLEAGAHTNTVPVLLGLLFGAQRAVQEGDKCADEGAKEESGDPRHSLR